MFPMNLIKYVIKLLADMNICFIFFTKPHIIFLLSFVHLTGLQSLSYLWLFRTDNLYENKIVYNELFKTIHLENFKRGCKLVIFINNAWYNILYYVTSNSDVEPFKTFLNPFFKFMAISSTRINVWYVKRLFLLIIVGIQFHI